MTNQFQKKSRKAAVSVNIAVTWFLSWIWMHMSRTVKSSSLKRRLHGSSSSKLEMRLQTDQSTTQWTSLSCSVTEFRPSMTPLE